MIETATGNYLKPTTLADLLRHLDEDPGSVLAGGTDLVLMRASRLVDRAQNIIDVKGIAQLQGVDASVNGTISIGATTTLQRLASAAELPPNAVTDGAALVGGWQTRQRGTIGGNICRASPAGDTLPGILVCQAQLELASRWGTRRVNADEFFLGPGLTLREPAEVLTRLIIVSGTGGSAYVRFTNRRAMDLAVVGVAAWVELEDDVCVDARIGLSAAAPTPVLAPEAGAALVGTRIDAAAIASAADLVLTTATPIDDGRGSRKHRLATLPVLARRAIKRAHERAIASREHHT